MNEAAYIDYFGIWPAEARILAYLRECSSTTSPRSAQAVALAAGINPSSVKVSISRLRDAMETEAIDTIPARGGGAHLYLLTEVGLEECRKAVDEYRKAVAA